LSDNIDTENEVSVWFITPSNKEGEELSEKIFAAVEKILCPDGDDETHVCRLDWTMTGGSRPYVEENADE
jgi:hypothetical protein